MDSFLVRCGTIWVHFGSRFISFNLIFICIQRDRVLTLYVQLLVQREEAWKKIHLRALENPIKDQLRDYDVSHFISINNVSIAEKKVTSLWSIPTTSAGHDHPRRPLFDHFYLFRLTTTCVIYQSMITKMRMQTETLLVIYYNRPLKKEMPLKKKKATVGYVYKDRSLYKDINITE